MGQTRPKTLRGEAVSSAITDIVVCPSQPQPIQYGRFNLPIWRLEIMRYALTDYEWREAVRRQSYRTTEDGQAPATSGQLLSDIGS
jgi:hypothetical protein